MEYRSVRLRHNSYINLLVIQRTLRDRGVETSKTFIMEVALSLLRHVVEGDVEVGELLSSLVKVDPQLTAKLITLIYGREGINRVDGEVR